MSILDGFLSLGKNINKGLNTDQTDEMNGVVSPLIDELELPISDDELILLTKQWEHRWNESEVKKVWEEMSDENEKYWKGDQYKGLSPEDRPLQDNAIFEALETFLPQATRRNPEPIVELAFSEPKDEQTEILARTFEHRLAELADTLKLRLKIKRVARLWAIYLLGVAKVGWSGVTQDITVKVIRPKKLILDPDAIIDEDGYSGKYIGERRRMEAGLLARMMPEKKSVISKLVDGKMGTDVQFIEWWTDEYYCWTVRDEVLLKKKNPNWNYDQEEKTEEGVDDYGQPTQNVVPAVPGQNHFPAPKIPYIFLSIFNLGKQPIDDTSLITQNLSTQDLINKRLRQIDKNADKMNNGAVISGERAGLTKEQATQVVPAITKGGAVFIPSGSAQDAIYFPDIKPLSPDVFNQLADTRIRLKDVFGVRGLTTAGIQEDKTVRGKILNKSVDTDRIGGGITEYLEQFADDVYNWFVQLMYVYYPNLQGSELAKAGLEKIPKLIISVKEGSLLPKDTVSEANQAIELAMNGKMSLLDLYKKLEDPNPEEKAANVWLEVNAPYILYGKDPRIMQAMMMMQQAAQQQQQMEAEGKDKEHQQNMEGKMMDHQSKLDQQQVKSHSDQILAKVKTNK